MPLGEMTGKRVSAFSRERRPAVNGGRNHIEFASAMDAIDGDLDLVCGWTNCRKTLALIETTTRPDQSVTYRRSMAKRLGVPFFHVREIQMPDGSWRYTNMNSGENTPTLTIDEWITMYEVPLRRRHGCLPFSQGRKSWGCATFDDCDGDPEWHCATCGTHKDAWWMECRKGCV